MTGPFYITTTIGKDGRPKLGPSDLAVLLPLTEEKVIVRVEKWSPRRSLAANNFYWGVIVSLLVDYTRHSKDEIHAILKQKFATETQFVANEETGEVIIEEEVPIKTRHMTKAQFAEYLDKCINLCDELGIILPHYEGDRYAYADDGQD